MAATKNTLQQQQKNQLNKSNEKHSSIHHTNTAKCRQYKELTTPKQQNDDNQEYTSTKTAK